MDLLQEHVKELKSSNGQLLSKVNDNMNVGYACALKIFLSWKMKHPKLFLDKVRSLIHEAQVEIPDSVIDRAHRIGPVRSVNNKSQSIIVRLSTFPSSDKVISSS